MTSKERIEELLNCYGETLEDLPKRPIIGFVYSEEDLQDANNLASVWSFGEGFHDCSSLVLLDFICHQSDVIEKLIKALESDRRKPETNKKEYDKDKLNEVLDGLYWILHNDDKLGLGTHWPEASKPQDYYEQAGYNVQRAIDFLTWLKGTLPEYENE